MPNDIENFEKAIKNIFNDRDYGGDELQKLINNQKQKALEAANKNELQRQKELEKVESQMQFAKNFTGRPLSANQQNQYNNQINKINETFDKQSAAIEENAKATASNLEKILDQWKRQNSSISSIISGQERIVRNLEESYQASLHDEGKTDEDINEAHQKYQEAEAKLFGLYDKINEAQYNNSASLAEKYQNLKSRYDARKNADKEAKIKFDITGDEEEYKKTLEKNEAKYGNISASQLMGSALLGGQNLVGVASELINSSLSQSAQGQAILAIASEVEKINKVLSSGVTEAANLASTYLSKIDARLQGSTLDSSSSGKIYDNIMTNFVNKYFASSPYVSQKKLLENISATVDKGIAWNVEERALIQTLADKMVTTFDALDASLTRLIRLQGTDLTYASMGAEAELTQFLNRNYSDTSYLTNLYDTVSDAILDSSSLLSSTESIGYNYAVQKWLGSLYSVGMSESAISSIAQGLNALVTGQTSGTDNSMFRLLAMAATNSGMNLADIMRSGLDSSGMNILMESVIEYLQQITDNQNRYSAAQLSQQIGGLSLADLRAVSNLTTQDITNISSSSVDYYSAREQFYTQLEQVASRTSVGDWANNLVDNLLLSFGELLIGSGSSTDPNSLSQYLGWTVGGKIGGTIGTGMQLMSGASSLINDISQRNASSAAINEAQEAYNTAYQQYVTHSGVDSDVDATLYENYIAAQERLENLLSRTNGSKVLNFIQQLRQGQLSGISQGAYLGSIYNVDSDTSNPSFSAMGVRSNLLPFLTASSVAQGGSSSTTSRGGLDVLYTNASTGLTGVSQGVSYSVTNASAIDKEYGSLANNEVTTLSASNVTGSSTTVRDIGDIYAKLFEHRDVPIRVQLANVEDDAKKSLLGTILDDIKTDLSYLAEQASGTGINVDLGNEDANTIARQIYTVRYSN